MSFDLFFFFMYSIFKLFQYLLNSRLMLYTICSNLHQICNIIEAQVFFFDLSC